VDKYIKNGRNATQPYNIAAGYNPNGASTHAARLVANGPVAVEIAKSVEEYMEDRNATQAAIRTNYSAKTARQIGSKLLSKVDIAAEIAKRVEEYSRTTASRWSTFVSACHRPAEIGLFC
jgi:phage terminase small subunit